MANPSTNASWFDAFTHRVADFFSETPTATTDAAAAADEVSAKIEDKQRLTRSVVATLEELLPDTKAAAEQKLIVWIDTDQLTFNVYNTPAYHAQLEDALANECGCCFRAIELRIGAPDAADRATPIGDSGKLYLLVEAPQQAAPQVVSRKASIRIFGDAGSLMQPEYILSTEEMHTRGIKAYNIGAGRTPQVPTGYRENHIAIDSDPNSPMVDKNKFVSRMHAHIGFSDQFGFYLQVELDGTRLMGKRTRIFRGEQKIECDNPQIKVPLQDGDLIELGKAVVLQYSEIQ